MTTQRIGLGDLNKWVTRRNKKEWRMHHARIKRTLETSCREIEGRNGTGSSGQVFADAVLIIAGAVRVAFALCVLLASLRVR